MPFIEPEDIRVVIDDQTLDDIKQENEPNLARAIMTAIDEAFGYLNVRFDAEAIFAATGDDRSRKVIEVVIDMLLYQLHSSISPDNIPELRVKRREEAINWLEKVAAGFINPNLPVKANQPTTPLRYGSSNPKMNNYY